MPNSESTHDSIDLEKHGSQDFYEGFRDDLVELPQILKETITGFGGLAALLLQIAHPGVARGVNNHSEFADRQLDRGEKTAIFVYTMVYGTRQEKSFIKEWVDRRHSQVKGGEGKDKYHAKDPDLQLWVAATLYATMAKLYEMAFGALTPDRAERVYQEFAVFATALQVPKSSWPKDRQAFKAYYDQVVENDLRVVPEGEQVFYHIMHPKLPLVFRPLIPVFLYLAQIFAAELLPPQVFSAYGLTPKNGRKDRLARKLVIFQYRCTPPFIRSLPKRYYMRRSRKMIAKLKERGFGEDIRMRAH